MAAGNPTLENVFDRVELLGLARKRRRLVDRQTVRRSEVEERLAQGWKIHRDNKRTVVVSRPKKHDVLLEDRVWMLLYSMGFGRLSGHGGALLTSDQASGSKLTSQIDVVGIDEDVVLAIECKSSQTSARRGSLQEELAKHGLTRQPLARAVQAPGRKKVIPILAFFTQNAILSSKDRDRAKDQNIALFDDRDLQYYEALTQHLGTAARYQFLADLAPGRDIPGLHIRVPALKTKMGGYVCYTFSISPAYLLKIASVSHRARGQASDIKTYQRMLSRARLRKIARYIGEPDGIFPTNIVLNLEFGKRGTTFERGKQEDNSEGATFGWLTLRPAYRSAWVIDGQHRLYAYSGHERAESSRLSVLAFENLPGHVQQKLFIDINAEQKSVKKSLLQELYADLLKSSSDPSRRIQAFISQSIQQIDSDPKSPLFDRILLADDVHTTTRCISLNSVFSALDRLGMYYGGLQGDTVIDPGPLWGDSETATVKRTASIINGWFEFIRSRVPDWWDLGADEGGGLAMNDGVTVCINVLRSVFEHLEHQGKTPLFKLTPSDILERLAPFGEALGDHFALMSPEKRNAFRALRGVQGQNTGTRHAQAFLQSKFPSFQPEGLPEFLEREKAQTNIRASALINEIEKLLSAAVLGTLKEEYGTEGDAWWYEAVPKSVRTAVTQRREEDDNKAGSREAYFDLIQYRAIAVQNWPLFEPILAHGKKGASKNKRTEWLVRVNEIRKLAAHASRGATVSLEQLSELELYLAWLQGQVVGGPAREFASDGASEADH